MNLERAISERDRLTGIYSRDYFDETARTIVDENPDVEFAVMELDINRLTVINELYGVSEGDNVLKYMGATLEDEFRLEPHSIYARVQADLFAILTVFDPGKMEQHIKNIEDSMHKYSLMLNIDILLSFGIYVVDDRTLDMQIMRDRAKLALKTIKGNYIVHFAYYDERIHELISEEQEVLQNMNNALWNREFVVYYQPKHSLDDESIIGAEALVRWDSSHAGMIAPNKFIPIFESNGFIMKLDRYVWEEVCIFIREQLDKGIPLKPISVNISRINLYNPELANIFAELIDKYKIPASMLELEFTESAYTDNPHLMLQTMINLQNLGFKVEMDDFGSGYSSLNMLKDVPVDGLKIDLNFLSKTSNSEKAIIIMSSIIRMVKWLGIPSVVEGVETEEQIKFLKSIGCTSVQGYYFAKPMPADEYVEYISKYSDLENFMEEEILHETVEVANPNQIWEMITANRSEDFPIFDAYGLYEVSNDSMEMLRASDGYYSLFKTSRQDNFNYGGMVQHYVHPDDIPLVDSMIQAARTGHKFGTAVFRHICGDGSIVWVYARARLLGVNSLRNARIFYIGLNDITEHMDRL